MRFPLKSTDELQADLVAAVTNKDLPLAAMFHLDLEQRREQTILAAIEKAKFGVIVFIMIFGAILFGLNAIRHW